MSTLPIELYSTTTCGAYVLLEKVTTLKFHSLLLLINVISWVYWEWSEVSGVEYYIVKLERKNIVERVWEDKFATYL